MQIVVSLGACIVNIVGNTILVPKLGCQGAAISTGFSYIIFFTLRTVLSKRYFYVDFHLKKFYLITVLSVIYAFNNTFIKFNMGSIIGYLVCMAVLLFLYRDTVKFSVRYATSMVNGFLRKKAE